MSRLSNRGYVGFADRLTLIAPRRTRLPKCKIRERGREISGGATRHGDDLSKLTCFELQRLDGSALCLSS